MARVLTTSTQRGLNQLSYLSPPNPHLLGTCLPSRAQQLFSHRVCMVPEHTRGVPSICWKGKQHPGIPLLILLHMDSHSGRGVTTNPLYPLLCWQYIVPRLAALGKCRWPNWSSPPNHLCWQNVVPRLAALGKCRWPNSSSPPNHHETICQSPHGGRALFIWAAHKECFQFNVRWTQLFASSNWQRCDLSFSPPILNRLQLLLKLLHFHFLMDDLVLSESQSDPGITKVQRRKRNGHGKDGLSSVNTSITAMTTHARTYPKVQDQHLWCICLCATNKVFFVTWWGGVG